jgi:hypothetical protein
MEKEINISSMSAEFNSSSSAESCANEMNKSYEESFTKPIIRIGRATLLSAFVACFLPSIYLAVRYGAIPPVGAIVAGWVSIASIYAPYWFVEPISYFPILGMAGTYMSFLAGEIGNMRLPCSAIAQDVLKVERGSKKAELVSTLAIAGSVVTSLVAGTLAVIAGSYILSVLPPFVVKAFDFVLPAIFGAMFAMFAVKSPKYGIYALALTCFLVKIVKVLPVYVIIPIVIFSTIALSFLEYKKKAKSNL